MSKFTISSVSRDFPWSTTDFSQFLGKLRRFRPILDHPTSPENASFISRADDAAADQLIEALTGHFSGGVPASEFEPAMIADLRKELDRGELVSADMVQLWRMLSTLAARLPHPPGGQSDSNGDAIDLLNLACGHCEEAAVLAAFFGRAGRRVRFFGMDVRDREIETAKRRYQATENAFRKLGVPKLRGDEGEGDAQFIADDATKLGGYREIPAEYDLIFLRHQNVWHDRDIWRRIYEFALARLPDHGYLVITSYFDREHLIALDLLKTIGAEVVVSLENLNSRPLDYPGKSIDRHIAALRKSI